jgi:RNA polymerase sigma-70 factor (ECF subfamily)
MRMTVDDENLARAAAQGDGTAFGVLLERHYDRLFGLCFRLTGIRAEAEDLTQDICAALPAKLQHFRGESRFATWLYRVAVNAAHDRRRRHATHRKAADGWGDWEIARQDEITESQVAHDWLNRAMGALPDELRETVALVMDGELTQATIAQVLGISEGTVAWRMSEVKKRLRAIKEKEGVA